MAERNPTCARRAAATVIVQPRDVCSGIGLACDCAESVVIAASCGSGVNIGDIVNVWDINRCFFNMPPELLFNSRFFAHNFKNATLIAPNEYEPQECVWIVTGACCVEG